MNDMKKLSMLAASVAVLSICACTEANEFTPSTNNGTKKITEIKVSANPSALGSRTDFTIEYDNGLPITAGSRAKTKHIASTHAYTVIGAYETEDNPPKKMIRLRNPWADAEIKTYLGIQLPKRRKECLY